MLAKHAIILGPLLDRAASVGLKFWRQRGGVQGQHLGLVLAAQHLHRGVVAVENAPASDEQLRLRGEIEDRPIALGARRDLGMNRA